MNIGVITESQSDEYRVALTPDAAKALIGKGFSVQVQSGAGQTASFADDAYTAVGCTIGATAKDVLGAADIVCKVQAPNADEVAMMKANSALCCSLNAWKNEDIVAALKAKGIKAFALERIPRISRAQSMDILSSMATVAGYKAVLLAAAQSGKFFPMFVTAAGTIPPTKCFIIGAGVAGLQAISSARRLGAIVEAFDVRPAVKEQVESLGAKFIEIDLGEKDTETSGGYAKELSEEAKKRQQEGMAKHIELSDVVITTAAIPGKPAPKIITDDMIARMKRGSIIVDLAAETGGNTNQTVAGQNTVTANGVTIIAPVNLAASMPIHASQMYAKNLVNLLMLLVTKEGISVHLNDEILSACCVTA
ncbi:MAG: Re/Si-specific NAD(P)(+) transhydrogenase subunit alpha [Candidatus Kapabacteria bacterium]|nr:Re/Si-specific NAD(P)(+) transhydrogenase subunit alpha [Candidatus Kapabacteria bacterium]